MPVHSAEWTRSVGVRFGARPEWSNEPKEEARGWPVDGNWGPGCVVRRTGRGSWGGLQGVLEFWAQAGSLLRLPESMSQLPPTVSGSEETPPEEGATSQVEDSAANDLPRDRLGPTEKSLAVLAWPLIVSFTLRSGFAWVDRIYAANLEDVDAAQAAIGLTMPFEFLLIACWVGASNGLTSKLSAAMGAGRWGEIEQLKAASRRLVLGLAVLFVGIAAAIWYAEPYQSAGEAVARNFKIYAVVVLGGTALTGFWSILPDSIVKAHQDTKTMMWAGLASSILNVLLNTLFVFVFHWGIFGIALSTALGRLGGLGYAVLRANAHEAERLASNVGRSMERVAAPLRSLLRIAIPSGLAYVLLAVEGLAVNAVLERAPNPEPALAAWSIFDSALRFLAMPVIATGVAMLMLAARLHGQGRMGALRAELGKGLRLLLIYCAVFVAPVSLLGGPWLAGALLEEPQAQAFGALGMRFLSPAVLAVGVVFLMRSIFDALDRASLGLALSAVRSIGLMVPAILLGGALAPSLGFSPMAGYYSGLLVGAALGALITALGVRPLLRTGVAG